jgi:putative nucleotide binding protein
MEKEEIAVVLDYLPYGYPLENRTLPVVQAIGKENLTLLQLAPRKGSNFEPLEEAYIGEGKRDKIQFIQGRLLREKLTERAKVQLMEFVSKAVKEKEGKYVDFFNKAQAMNTRLHQLELLPGFGKKHCNALLDERDKKPFESFEEIKIRVSGVPDPQKAIEKRIFEELTEIQRHNLFIR